MGSFADPSRSDFDLPPPRQSPDANAAVLRLLNNYPRDQMSRFHHERPARGKRRRPSAARRSGGVLGPVALRSQAFAWPCHYRGQVRLRPGLRVRRHPAGQAASARPERFLVCLQGDSKALEALRPPAPGPPCPEARKGSGGRQRSKPPSEPLAVFQALGIDREAIAALFFLQEAVKAREVSLALLGELGTYLKRVQREPGLVYRPS